jgi:hypothetical protein
MLHYHLLLPQAGRLLLKNSGDFRPKRYALFKRRFSKTLSSILSGEGFYEGDQGESPFSSPPRRPTLYHLDPRINSKTFEK